MNWDYKKISLPSLRLEDIRAMAKEKFGSSLGEGECLSIKRMIEIESDFGANAVTHDYLMGRIHTIINNNGGVDAYKKKNQYITEFADAIRTDQMLRVIVTKYAIKALTEEMDRLSPKEVSKFYDDNIHWMHLNEMKENCDE